MPFRSADIGTRMGAEAAAQQGALGCLLLGALTIAASLLSARELDPATQVGQIGIVLVALLVLLCFTAAWRLWRGLGAYLAMAVLVIGLFLFAMTLMIKPQSYEWVVVGLLLLPVVQGLRGALSLRGIARAEAVSP